MCKEVTCFFRKYKLVRSKLASCQGCAAQNNPLLCFSLPTCEGKQGGKYIWKRVREGKRDA